MPHRFEDQVLYRTAELFLEQDKVKQTAKRIADQVNRELRPNRPLTRQTVYRALAQARSSGIVRLVPPINRQLTEKLSRRFPGAYGGMTVVDTMDKSDNARVSVVAADRALEVIRQIGRFRATNTVGIGLGPGRATLDFCRHLGQLLRAESEFPKLRLVAISAGCPAKLPEYASSSFFNLFPPELLEEKIGLFAESVVRVRDFPRVRKTPGVHEAFDAKADEVIDLVVTSMGDFSDEHDLLRIFLSDAGMPIDEIRRRGWIGNVQYRPYTVNGPVEESPSEHRAVTLFELRDLISMSERKNKHVILIARQCGICAKTRAKALLPILTNPDLRVFSQLVLDAATAKDLLRQSHPRVRQTTPTDSSK